MKEPQPASNLDDGDQTKQKAKSRKRIPFRPVSFPFHSHPFVRSCRLAQLESWKMKRLIIPSSEKEKKNRENRQNSAILHAPS